MGKFSKGILGHFSGTVGTVVGSSWRGIDYMRSKANKKTGVATQAQLEQQQKFSLMIKFLQTLKGLLEITFQNYAVNMTGSNSALSYNLKNAITGAYPAFSIDYSMALLSRGDLPNATAPNATAGAAGKVHFTWTDNSGTGKALATDIAVLIVYCPDKALSIYTTNAAVRSAGSDLLDVTAFSGKTVQTWMAFISADGNEISNSVFTGQVNVV